MGSVQTVLVPDIGGSSDVSVIEILIKPGDTIEVETPLITLESDKASMEIPSSLAGVVVAIKVKVGDKVSEGDVILEVDSAGVALQSPQQKSVSTPAPESAPEPANLAPLPDTALPKTTSLPVSEPVSNADEHALMLAGPAARRLARVLGVDLTEVAGTGRKDRISKEDVEHYVKHRLSSNDITQSKDNTFALPKAAPIDFSKFGDIETRPLPKIKKLTGSHVHQSWLTIPMVTQFDSADITELEAFRKSESANAEAEGYKLTVLAFVCKAVYQSLVKFPQFNSSLDASGEHLIYKKYFNIGIAVDTPNGLVVPVVKGVNQLSIGGIAKEMARLSSKARDKGLTPAEMSGSCFTISSLGGIGGHAFTPIVSLPEVAILGLSRASMQPVYQKDAFVPRLILPLSLSYDHRVIDGAEAARFTRYLGELLSDIRRVML